MQFVYPSKTVSISLTGKACSLDCAHCGKHYLEHMIGIDEFLKNYSTNASCASVLVSGGCNSDGYVPLLSFRKELLEIRKLGIKINAHTGLFPSSRVKELKGLVDLVSFDFIGSDETIREVYGIQKSASDFLYSYVSLSEVVPTVPHITIGLRGGEIDGERNAIHLLSKAGCEKIVFNVFIPTKGTRFEKSDPPTIEDVVEILREARKCFSFISLGCMRPRGSYRKKLDEIVVKEQLVDGIVMADRKLAKKEVFEECCCFGL